MMSRAAFPHLLFAPNQRSSMAAGNSASARHMTASMWQWGQSAVAVSLPTHSVTADASSDSRSNHKRPGSSQGEGRLLNESRYAMKLTFCIELGNALQETLAPGSPKHTFAQRRIVWIVGQAKSKPVLERKGVWKGMERYRNLPLDIPSTIEMLGV